MNAFTFPDKFKLNQKEIVEPTKLVPSFKGNAANSENPLISIDSPLPSSISYIVREINNSDKDSEVRDAFGAALATLDLLTTAAPTAF